MTLEEAIALIAEQDRLIAELQARIDQREAELAAIGAGGVGSTPITRPPSAELIADAAEVIDTLTSSLPADHPLRASAENRAKRIVAALYEMAEYDGALTKARAALAQEQGGSDGKD